MIKPERVIYTGPAQLTNGGILPFQGTLLIYGTPTPTPTPEDVINLRAATLDPRISYTGPAQRYFNATGELVTSAENEWPLQYRNGVALGRHEPTTATANAISSLQTEYIAAGAADGWLTSYTEWAGNTYHRLRFNTSQTGPLTLQLFYKILGRENLCLRIATDAANNYRNVGIAGGDITYIGAGITDAAVIDYGGGLYLLRCSFNYISGVLGLLTAESAVTNDDVPRISVPDTSAGFIIGLPALVAGGQVAPPLAIGESLAAPSVTLDTSHAVAITVRYSDGTTDDHDTPGATFILPAATKDWGARVIESITLRQ